MPSLAAFASLRLLGARSASMTEPAHLNRRTTSTPPRRGSGGRPPVALDARRAPARRGGGGGGSRAAVQRRGRLGALGRRGRHPRLDPAVHFFADTARLVLRRRVARRTGGRHRALRPRVRHVARLPARFVFNKVPLGVPRAPRRFGTTPRTRRAKRRGDDPRRGGARRRPGRPRRPGARASVAALIGAVLTEGRRRVLPIIVAESAPVEALPREFARSRASRSSRGACCRRRISSCAPREKTPATERASASASENENASELSPGRRALPPARCRVGRARSSGWVRASLPLCARSQFHGRCRGVWVRPGVVFAARGAAGTAAIAAWSSAGATSSAREGVRVIGIVAGTLGVAGCLTAVARVRGWSRARVGRRTPSSPESEPAGSPTRRWRRSCWWRAASRARGRQGLPPARDHAVGGGGGVHARRRVGREVRLDFEPPPLEAATGRGRR